ncbi:ATP-binding cassette domain-containing protein [Streptomyces sp. NPDC001739]
MTLELSSCTYSYRRWKPPVLRDISYQLPDGLTVLLGPNGAGKSTLLRVAASVARPRTGTVTFGGLPSHAKDYRRAVGWMPQVVTPMAALTSRDYVAYVGWLKGLSRREAWDRAAEALARVDLTDRSTTQTTELSGGQLRRVGVAAALVHNARVLLLDEPTAGMDPYQRRLFRDTLRGLAGDVRVLLSTHDVMDLAEEADHVTVINDGKIVHNGTTEAFLARAGDEVVPGRTAEVAYTEVLRQFHQPSTRQG